MDWSSVESNTETNESTEYPEEEESIPEEQEKEGDPKDVLTKDQIQFFKDIFDSLDDQKKEAIPARTIGFALRMMGLNPTKAEIKKHVQEIDPQNTGLVDFPTFLQPIARKITQEPETHEDIIAAFEVLDEDDSGFLTTDRLYDFLTTLGEDLEDYEIELLLKMAETKGTRRVYYREFVEKMMGVVRKIPKEVKKKNKNKNKNKKKKK